MTTYFVTGATGFVGSALVRRLLSSGHEVAVLVRERSAADELATLGARVCRGSLGDPNAIAEAAEGAELLFHCAGEASHRAAPEALAWVNVAGTENVINAARHAGVRRVVQLSCADVTLHDRDRLHFRESQSLARTSFHACTRTQLLAEELALQASKSSFEVVALRPAWVWGPGDRRTLPLLCREASRGRVSLCGDGENLLATTHVDNLVHALVLAAGAEHVAGRAYHVVDAETLTAREFLTALCASLGLRPPRRGVYLLSYAAALLREPLRSEGLHRMDVVRRGRGTLYDASAAHNQLGFRPIVSVEEGMRALAEWAVEVGGPRAIAALKRDPTSAAELAELKRLAATSPPSSA